MPVVIHIPLNTSPEQSARLRALQQAFAQVCNALAPTVQQTRIWNRVALHHMAYRQLREQFPVMGSQMVCNAIYSVSRTSRAVFQDPRSPFFLEKLGSRALPLLRFAPDAPVYFDRHTLSLKESVLSLYTLDGRMRFNLELTQRQRDYFKTWKLREIVLACSKEGAFFLTFTLAEPEATQGTGEGAPTTVIPSTSGIAFENDSEPVGPVPEYIIVEDVAS